ncbi:MAG: hypothetical protein ACRDHP_11470 [Ktedonobacterales bacterium]
MPRERNKRPGERSLLARAQDQVGDGASLLFERLDAGVTKREQAADVLVRLAERVRAGAWDAELAELISRAEVIERDLRDA